MLSMTSVMTPTAILAENSWDVNARPSRIRRVTMREPASRVTRSLAIRSASQYLDERGQ